MNKDIIHDGLPRGWTVEWRDAFIAWYEEYKKSNVSMQGNIITNEELEKAQKEQQKCFKKTTELLSRLEKATYEIEEYLSTLKASSEKCDEFDAICLSDDPRKEIHKDDQLVRDELLQKKESTKNKLKTLVKGIIGK